MKNKSCSVLAVILALGASIAASSAPGETYRPNQLRSEESAQAPAGTNPQQLATIAAELAKTAANLAVAQSSHQTAAPSGARQAASSAGSMTAEEEIRQFVRSKQQRGNGATTVRWLDGSNTHTTSTRTAENNSLRSSSYPETRSSNALITDQGDTYYQETPVVQAAPTNTPIIRTQANEEIFYNARALQQAEAETIAPVAPDTEAKDFTQAAPTESYGGGGFSYDPCCGSGCDSYCEPGCGCARCRPCRRRMIVAGTEAVFLSPEFNGHRSSFVFEDFAESSHYHYAPGSSIVENADLDDFYVAPRLWLGVQGECWGVVGRYFHMRAGEHDHDPYFPLSFDQGFDVNSIFEAYYTDLELTRNFCVGGCKNQFSFGARYALIEHHESVIAMAEVPEGLINGGARSNRSAHGTGITFGLNGRKPLFCNSCAHWFYNVRSSILWGCNHNSVETWAESILIDPDADAIAGSKDGAIASVDDDLFIGEVQLGLEWNFAMRCLPAKSFFRVAFEYQYWDSSSGSATSGSFAGFGDPSPTSVGTAFADAPGLVVDLIGFNIGTGFTW